MRTGPWRGRRMCEGRVKTAAAGRAAMGVLGALGALPADVDVSVGSVLPEAKQPVYGRTHSGGLSAPVGASRPSSAVKPRRVLLLSRRKSAVRPTCGWQWSPEHARGLCQS